MGLYHIQDETERNQYRVTLDEVLEWIETGAIAGLDLAPPAVAQRIREVLDNGQ